MKEKEEGKGIQTEQVARRRSRTRLTKELVSNEVRRTRLPLPGSQNSQRSGPTSSRYPLTVSQSKSEGPRLDCFEVKKASPAEEALVKRGGAVTTNYVLWNPPRAGYGLFVRALIMKVGVLLAS